MFHESVFVVSCDFKIYLQTTNMDSRKTKTSENQKKRLIELLELNPQLRSGKFTSTFTYKSSQNCWNNISQELNALGPVKKEWKQWRKVTIFNYLQIENTFYYIFFRHGKILSQKPRQGVQRSGDTERGQVEVHH